MLYQADILESGMLCKAGLLGTLFPEDRIKAVKRRRLPIRCTQVWRVIMIKANCNTFLPTCNFYINFSIFFKAKFHDFFKVFSVLHIFMVLLHEDFPVQFLLALFYRPCISALSRQPSSESCTAVHMLSSVFNSTVSSVLVSSHDLHP